MAHRWGRSVSWPLSTALENRAVSARWFPAAVATPCDCGVVLSSSRRVKKGPGRRPLSDHRRRFMELRERGWGVRAAAREVGVSSAAGQNWAAGYKVVRRGEIVFVPPLERLAVRCISSRFLSVDERIEIADLHVQGVSVREIARRWGGLPRRCHESCAATPAPAATVRSTPTGWPRLGGPATTCAGSTRMTCTEGSWLSCWRSGGVRRRSAASCAGDIPATAPCGSARKASTRPCTDLDHC